MRLRELIPGEENVTPRKGLRLTDQGFAYRAISVSIVAILAMALWVDNPHANASEVSETPCASADFTIDEASQTVPFYYGRSNKEGAGAIHVTVPSRGNIAIVGVADGRYRAGGLADSAGTYGFDVFVWRTDPELMELSTNQESVTEEYEVTFTPFNELGNQSGDPCVKTTAITYVPAEAPYIFFGCGFTVEETCYETAISLSVKGRVWSGEVHEPAGGRRCLTNAVVGFEKRRIDGTWKIVGGWGTIKVKNGLYSVRMDRSNRFWSKKTARLFSNGTFRTFVPRAWLTSDAAPSEWCGASASAPVRIRS